MQLLTQLVGVLVAVVGIPVALERFTASARLRASLTTAATLLDKLPEDSPARGTLLAHLERQVQRIVVLETPGTSFGKGALAGGVGSILAGIAVGLAGLGASRQPNPMPGLWWLYAEAVLGIGLGLAWLLIERDRTTKARKAAEAASR